MFYEFSSKLQVLGSDLPHANRAYQADSSAVEHPLYTGEVVGSNPAPPTKV